MCTHCNINVKGPITLYTLKNTLILHTNEHAYAM